MWHLGEMVNLLLSFAAVSKSTREFCKRCCSLPLALERLTGVFPVLGGQVQCHVPPHQLCSYHKFIPHLRNRSPFPKHKNAPWLYLHLPAAAWDTTGRRRSSRKSIFMAFVDIVELHHKAAENKRHCEKKEPTCIYKALMSAIRGDLAILFGPK